MKQLLLESINSDLIINDRLAKLSTSDIGQLDKEQIYCKFEVSSEQLLDSQITIFMKSKMSSNLLRDSSTSISNANALHGKNDFRTEAITPESVDSPLDWQVSEQTWLHVVNRILNLSNSLFLREQLKRYDLAFTN
jgi:hypothetical protein